MDALNSMIDVEIVDNYDSQIRCRQKKLRELQETFFGTWGTLTKFEARKNPVVMATKLEIIDVELEIRDLRSNQQEIIAARTDLISNMQKPKKEASHHGTNS